MVINRSISPLANILALVNAKNSTSFDETQISAGVVSTATGHEGENSQITLTGIEGHGFKDSETFFYNRYDLNGGKDPDPASVTVTAADTQSEVKTKIADAYALMLSELVINDGNDITLPTEGNPVTVPMAVVDGSLLYVGDPITVTLTL